MNESNKLLVKVFNPSHGWGRGGSGAVRNSLQRLVSLTCDDIELLLTCEVDELHGVATDTDGEVSILGFLRMLHGVLELVHTEDVDVEVVSTLVEVTVHDTYEGLGTLLIVVAEGVRTDSLRVGDTVERILIRQLSH